MIDDYEPEHTLGPFVWGDSHDLRRSDDYHRIPPVGVNKSIAMKVQHVDRIRSGFWLLLKLICVAAVIAILAFAGMLVWAYLSVVIPFVAGTIAFIVLVYVLGYIAEDFWDDLDNWQ